MNLDQELRRYIFQQGPGRGYVVKPISMTESSLTTAGSLPGWTRDPYGFKIVIQNPLSLEQPFGNVCSRRIPLAQLLYEWFRPVRFEPDSTYNYHRYYASVRSKFPVEIFLQTEQGAWYMNVREGKLLGRDPSPPPLTIKNCAIHLIGCWTHLPDYYRSLRPTLVDAEIGINLRHLLLALAVGKYEQVSMQEARPDVKQIFDELGFFDTDQWASPVSVLIEGDLSIGPSLTLGRLRLAEPITWPTGDETLEKARRLDRNPNRKQEGFPKPNQDPKTCFFDPSKVLSPLPTISSESWSQVLYRRTSGRMPLKLGGMAGRRHRLARRTLNRFLDWVNADLPKDLGQRRAGIQITVLIQGIEETASGVWALEAGKLRLIQSQDGIMDGLEEIYGYSTSPVTSCHLHKASMLWIISADILKEISTEGILAWRGMQFFCGWIAHGICIGAAENHLFARPVRAFDEISLVNYVGLSNQQTPMLEVIVGKEAYSGLYFDIQ